MRSFKRMRFGLVFALAVGMLTVSASASAYQITPAGPFSASGPHTVIVSPSLGTTQCTVGLSGTLATGQLSVGGTAGSVSLASATSCGTPPSVFTFGNLPRPLTVVSANAAEIQLRATGVTLDYNWRGLPCGVASATITLWIRSGGSSDTRVDAGGTAMCPFVSVVMFGTSPTVTPAQSVMP